MAWPTRYVFSVGEKPSASNLNNNFSAADYTVPAIVTTKGDMGVASGANALARLPAGVDYGVPGYLASATMGMQTLGAQGHIHAQLLDTVVSNTAAETTFFTWAVPANWLGTNVRGLYLHALIEVSNSGATRAFTCKGYYGATNATVTDSSVISSAGLAIYLFEAFLFPDGATNKQFLLNRLWIPNSSLAAGAQGEYAPYFEYVKPAEDSTVSKNFYASLTMSAASANFTATPRFAYIAPIVTL